MADHPPLIICHDCDLLQHEVSLARGAAARCSRCGATLYRNATDSLNRTLALSLSGLVLFLISNLYPVLIIRDLADSNSVTLYGAVNFLWHHHMPLLALVVFATAIFFPAMQLVLFIYILLPLYWHEVPPGVMAALRMLRVVRAWSMVDVFLLGVLVSLTKIRYNFSVTPGLGLWSFGALTVLYAALAACYSEHDLWARLEREGAEEPP